MTTRRSFIGLLVAGVAVSAVKAHGEPSTKVSHIGVLALADIPYANDALRQGLRRVMQ